MNKLLAATFCLFLFSGCAATERASIEYECADIQACAQKIMLRVREKSQWICDQKSNDKVVVVESIFSPTGDIVDMKLSSSSGDSEFDTAAFDAIKAAAPLVELTLLNKQDFAEASVINFKFVGNKESK